MVESTEKIEASIMLLSYLDTIGFKNGQWEFNYNKNTNNIDEALEMNFTIINHYMSLGGFTNLDIKGWRSSDDTILMIATIKALIDGGKEKDFIKRYIEIYDELIQKERASGISTIKSISFLKKLVSRDVGLKRQSYLDLIPFNDNMGGNGAAIRTGPIGIYYANNIDKLISVSITASRLTHNIPIGYLGGLMSALFASYAYKGIDPCQWIDNLIDLLKTDKINKYINSTNIGKTHDKEIKDYFLSWHKYKEIRHSDIIKYRDKAKFIFPKERLLSLSEFITKEYFLDKNNVERWDLMGASGLDSVIYAYDSLLMSIVPNTDSIKYNAEIFLFYSCLHVGDSDSTGAIGGFWFGALLGYNNFDTNKIKNIEFYDSLKKLSKIFIKVIK
jgi:ADP-ribosylarginine hydrolase